MSRSSVPDAVAPSRRYRMRRRAERVDETRRRIVDAAMRLHTTVGPSAASMSAIADEAGVSRVTLYRHYPNADELFAACMGHWRSLHPPPDARSWADVSDFEARARGVLGRLYAWYAENAGELLPIYRDASFTPDSNRRARRSTNERFADAIVSGLVTGRSERRRLRAAALHAVLFWTWRSLAVDGGLSTDESVELAARFVLAARSAPDRSVTPAPRAAPLRSVGSPPRPSRRTR